jgi:hypothetical protein
MTRAPDLHGMVSTLNEAFARKAIRDLLHEYDGHKLMAQLKLSRWLEEEYQTYINPPPPVSKDWTS